MSYTLTNVSASNISDLMYHQPFVVLNSLSRVDIMKLMNDSGFRSKYEVIKKISPVLDKAEISQITDKNVQRAALEKFLKTKGTPQDYEDSVDIDGRLLKSVPNGRRNTALVKRAIASGALPTYDSLPKNFRKPTHALFRLYFTEFDKLNNCSNPEKYNSPRELMSYKSEALEDVLTAFKTTDPELTIRLFVLLYERERPDLTKFEKIVKEHGDFLKQHAERLFPKQITGLPTSWMLEYMNTTMRMDVVEIMNNAKRFIQLESRNYYGVASRSRTCSVSADMLCKYQPWVTLQDVINLKDVLDTNPDMRWTKLSMFPQTKAFEAELSLLFI